MNPLPMLLSIMLLAGCSDDPAQPSSKPASGTKPVAPAATRPATVPVTNNPIPILYVYPNVQPLSPKMVDVLLNAAASSKPAREGRRPWFIAAHQNRGTVDDRFYRIMLYFSPDRSTNRVRTGRFLQLWWWTGKQPTLCDYVQVSRPDQPFTENLEQPNVTDLPFELEDPAPEGSEWAEFIDFARPLLEQEYKPDERPPPYLISRKKADLYVVATGTDEGGDGVYARKTAKGFTLVHQLFWSGHPWGDFPD